MNNLTNLNSDFSNEVFKTSFLIYLAVKVSNENIQIIKTAEYQTKFFRPNVLK